MRGQNYFSVAEFLLGTSLHSPAKATEPQYVFGAATLAGTYAQKSRQDM